LSEEKKAFLLRGVNKRNSGGCQGRANKLEWKKGARKNENRTGESEKDENSGSEGKRLTGNQQIIQSLLVQGSAG
jgi:hypothetical protein